MVAIALYRVPGRGTDESSGNTAGNRGQEQQQDDINVSNPQRGEQWNNYQSRELGSGAEGNISEEEISEAFEEEDE